MSDTPEDIDAIYAGEYVLGVLGAEERAQVEARIASDEVFAAYVQAWVQRLTPLAEEVSDVTPSRALKKRIALELFGDDAKRNNQKLRSSVSFWRLATSAMTALALTAIAALFMLSSFSPSRGTAYIATLLPADSTPILTAAVDKDFDYIQIRGALIEAAGDQAAELWLIPEDGTPRSLGLISTRGDSAVAVQEPLRALFKAGAILAVSIEPTGGSPTGAPTGPVVGLGALLKN